VTQFAAATIPTDNAKASTEQKSQMEDLVNISLVAIEKEGVVKLAASGSITAANFDASGKNPLERILGQNWSGFRVMLDMKAATYIDSSAIGWVLASVKAFNAGGGMLVLHDVPLQIRQVFDLLHIGKILPIAQNTASAREMILGGAK